LFYQKNDDLPSFKVKNIQYPIFFTPLGYELYIGALDKVTAKLLSLMKLNSNQHTLFTAKQAQKSFDL